MEQKRNTPLSTLLAGIEDDARQLIDLLPLAEEHRWYPAPHKRHAQLALHRASSDVPMPTEDAALDDRRMALSDAVAKACRRLGQLQALTLSLQSARRELQAARSTEGVLPDASRA